MREIKHIPSNIIVIPIQRSGSGVDDTLGREVWSWGNKDSIFGLLVYGHDVLDRVLQLVEGQVVRVGGDHNDPVKVLGVQVIGDDNVRGLG